MVIEPVENTQTGLVGISTNTSCEFCKEDTKRADGHKKGDRKEISTVSSEFRTVAKEN
jgi:hypothetical protein